MGKVIFIPGRFNPPHKGHISVFEWLLSISDRLVIGIGSCYEVGTARHPLLAIFREKMILASLAQKGLDISRIAILHLPDFNDWDEWWKFIAALCREKGVTHFATGNEKDILGVMQEKGITAPFALINPEKELPQRYQFTYHATDMREAIARGDYNLFKKIAAPGTSDLMGNVGGFPGIRMAMEADACLPKFNPGRQAVDLIVLSGNGEKYVLCGKRKKNKEDFPGKLALPGGAIDLTESPMDAAVRELYEEAGLEVKIVGRHYEPAHVLVQGNIISEMRFLKLFSSADPKRCGNQGGSSQAFLINLDKQPDYFRDLKSESDLEEVAFRPVEQALKEGLAYQQNEMVKMALKFAQF